MTPPGQLGGSSADMLTADANHLEDVRPELTNHHEQPGDSDGCDYQSDMHEPGFVHEPLLNPPRDAGHGEREQDRDGHIHQEVETSFRNTVTRAGEIGHRD